MVQIVWLLFICALPRPTAGQANATDDCAAAPPDQYDVSAHIGGVFIVLVTSVVGTCASVVVGSLRQTTLTVRMLDTLKMFGIGVIAATAWIHLLPDAFAAFGDPCLTGHWQDYGTNYVGLFGLIGAFLVQIVGLVSKSHGHEIQSTFAPTSQAAGGQLVQHNSVNFPAEASSPILGFTPILRKALDSQSTGLQPAPASLNEAAQSPLDQNTLLDSPGEATPSLKHTAEQLGLLAQVLILEIGILVHSLIIGLTLGVTPDSEFTTLLIALCFHQFFEGLAIGSLLASTVLAPASKFFFSLLYSVTTPIGIAIGVGVRSSFNESTQAAILVRGIMYALSAGIMIYNAYGELTNNEINRSAKFSSFSRRYKVLLMFSMYLGGTSMAIVGYWA